MTNEKQYSERIAALIKQFLDEDEWKYTFYEEDGVFTFGELIDGAIKTIHYRVFVRQDDYIVNASVEIGAEWKLTETEEFPGFSHEKITKEIYCRE